ncbi:unnamed protein product, partial [marine sediment metagenome]
MREAGFSVDVYEGEEITVEFYRTLPTKGYQLILFRTHSTSTFVKTLTSGPVVLYTSELYEENKYVREQLANRIKPVIPLYDPSAGPSTGSGHPDDSPLYFAIAPGFVSRDMIGRFEETLLIIGGCDILGKVDLAQAFIERGASTVVGWNEWVDIPHNDKVLLHLLRGLTVEELTTEQAVTKTMNEIGPDPAYRSFLTYFPRGKKTALVDQVVSTYPNPEFTDQALAYLREAGFSVDVYEGEEITVEFYRTLSAKGYQL